MTPLAHHLPRIILITGTDTGVGKTVATAALASALHAAGRTVAVYKPCQSGADDGDSDISEVARLAGPRTVDVGVVLGAPLAPVQAAAAEGVALPPLETHESRVRRLAATHSHVLVEGAGGLLVELAPEGRTLADLAARLGADAAVLVVVRPSLGTLNHTALTLEALEQRGLAVTGLLLGSWPAEPGPAETGNRALLSAGRVPLLGALPEAAAALPVQEFRDQAPRWVGVFREDGRTRGGEPA